MAAKCEKSSAMDEETIASRPTLSVLGRKTSTVSPEMCCYCFDVLIGHLNGGYSRKTSYYIPNEEFPLFVTWKIGREQRLRGCMGTFSAKKLPKGLAEYSITSSMKDSRFKPIRPDEVPRLHCAVSLLTNFEKGEHYLDWEIGIHGIQIEFVANGSLKTATYLPEVASEQGWSKLEAIDSLLRKGGYKELITQELRQSIKLTRYRSEKCSLTYEEYCRIQRRHKPY